MSLATQVANVGLVTNRPDMASEITYAVKAATLKAHQIDFFPRDLISATLTNATPTLQTGTFTYASLAGVNGNQARAINNVQDYPTNTTDATRNKYFLPEDANNLADAYAQYKLNVWYSIGSSFYVRSSTILQRVIVTYYINPDIGDATYTSWIDSLFPNAITLEAARAIFAMIGKDEEASRYRALVAEEYALLRTNAIQAVGY